jgi:hypothetical protein
MIYLRYRFFLICCFFYVLNRWLVLPVISLKYPELSNCIRDFLVIPCLCSMWLILCRFFGFKNVNYPPTASDLIYSWGFFSLLLELILPKFLGLGVGDPLDVVYYGMGTLLGVIESRIRMIKEKIHDSRSRDITFSANVDERISIKGF